MLGRKSNRARRGRRRRGSALGADAPGHGAGDVRPRALAQGQVALGGELPVGVDHDRARDAELPREVARRRHARAGLERAVADRARRSWSSICAPSVAEPSRLQREQEIDRLTGLVHRHQNWPLHVRQWTVASRPWIRSPPHSGARWLFAVSILARLPLAMLSIALLVHAEHLTGSFAAAGAVPASTRRRSASAARCSGRSPIGAARRPCCVVSAGVAAALLVAMAHAAGRRAAGRAARAGRRPRRWRRRRSAPACARCSPACCRTPASLRAAYAVEASAVRAHLDLGAAARAGARRAVVHRRRARRRPVSSWSPGRSRSPCSPRRGRWRAERRPRPGRAAARCARRRCGRS